MNRMYLLVQSLLPVLRYRVFRSSHKQKPLTL
ncbi:Uncharacterised protein [Vibrio cholerae]|nr:Uncharacterised protein [Vibrio cholerae]